MSDDLSEMILDVAKSIVKGLNTVGTTIRQAKITAIAAGSPRTATIEIDSMSVSGVVMMDHVKPALNTGVWFADLGEGRWVIIGSSSSRSVIGQVVGWTTATASSYTNATATETDVTATTGSAPSITATLDTSRVYEFGFNGQFSCTANAVINVRLLEGGAQRAAGVYWFAATGVGLNCNFSQLLVPASGASTVYKIAAMTNGGTIAAIASASTPIQFWIKDAGPA